jgi:hypothetical protein
MDTMGMSEPVTRWRRPLSRRAALALGFGLTAMPARADEPQANPNKILQVVAEYQPTPKGMFSCAVCTFFIKPQSCKVVDGEVSATGWCKLFDMVD